MPQDKLFLVILTRRLCRSATAKTGVLSLAHKDFFPAIFENVHHYTAVAATIPTPIKSLDQKARASVDVHYCTGRPVRGSVPSGRRKSRMCGSGLWIS